jgi:hypothetical protein
MKEKTKRIEVFRGHMDECLGHLDDALTAKVPKNSKGILQFRRPIFRFCGVEDKTLKRWLRADTSPSGEAWIKLMCCLDILGYRIIELERMPKALKGCVELIGFGFYSGQQLAERLSFAQTFSIYSVLKGKQKISDEKRKLLWDAWKEKKDDIERKKEQVRKSMHAIMSASERPHRAATAFSHQGRAAISIMSGLLDLLEAGSLKELAACDVTVLQKAGGDTIMRTSAHLNTLNSRLILSKKRSGDAHDAKAEPPGNC